MCGKATEEEGDGEMGRWGEWESGKVGDGEKGRKKKKNLEHRTLNTEHRMKKKARRSMVRGGPAGPRESM